MKSTGSGKVNDSMHLWLIVVQRTGLNAGSSTLEREPLRPLKSISRGFYDRENEANI